MAERLYWASVLFTIVIMLSYSAAQDRTSECNNKNKVPYKATVREDGTLEINCRSVDCVDASKEEPVCESEYHANGCGNYPQWLQGVQQSNDTKGPLKFKCCSHGSLNDSIDLGTAFLQKNQGFVGGFAYIKGKENTNQSNGFDVITDVTKEKHGYRIWVSRMPCAPIPKQGQPSQQEYFDTVEDPSVENVPVSKANGRAHAHGTSTKKKHHGCFPAETMVETETRGTIPMSELRVGEKVLTLFEGALIYLPVTFFLHRDHNRTAEYLTLHTDRQGVSVTMTPFHITFSGPCQENHKYPLKFANEVQPGHCLMYVDKVTGRVDSVRVTSVTKSYRQGVYSPMTDTGAILTNNLLSSCYSFIKNPLLQAIFFKAVRSLESFMHDWFFLPEGLLLGGDHNTVDVSTGLEYILAILNKIIPISKILQPHLCFP